MDRILIADDANIGRSILKSLLSRDFEVLEASNGLEAVQRLEAESTDIHAMILDLMMPVMDGFKVLAFMREHNLFARIPVLVLSAVSNPDDIAKALEAGAFDVIEKPYDSTVLLAKVHSAVQRIRAIRNDAIAEARATPGSGADDLFCAVLDALPQAVFVADAATRRVVHVNAAFDAFPSSVASPVGHVIPDLLPAAEATAVSAAIDDLAASRVPRAASIAAADGSRYTLLLSAVLNDDDDITHFVGSIVRA